jgi:hypothetical protein
MYPQNQPKWSVSTQQQLISEHKADQALEITNKRRTARGEAVGKWPEFYNAEPLVPTARDVKADGEKARSTATRLEAEVLLDATNESRTARGEAKGRWHEHYNEEPPGPTSFSDFSHRPPSPQELFLLQQPPPFLLRQEQPSHQAPCHIS